MVQTTPTAPTAPNALARHLPPDRAEQQARPADAAQTAHSVNALGVRGSSRFTAESHPSFPFTHYALSECAFRAGDDAWRQHVDRALEILRHITRIAGHHRHHAEVYQCLRSRPRTAAVTMRRGSSRQKPSRTTKATTAGRTRRSASSPAATAPVTRPHKHEQIVNVLLEGPSSNSFDLARASLGQLADLDGRPRRRCQQ